MHHLLVRHEVADFEAWKAVFDSHAEAQHEAGLRVTRVLRNIDNPNDVFLLFEVDDLEKARGFVSSPAVPEAQRDSGVIGEPEIVFLS
jgi:hypothetical protein